jgi:hypothetical protein
VVFKRQPMTPEPEQLDFIKRVEDYETGVVRGTFGDIGQLIERLASAVETASAAVTPVVPRPIGAVAIAVPWRPVDRGMYTGAGVVLETHVLPIEPLMSTPASALDELARTLARGGREHGLFDERRGVELSKDEAGATARAQASARDGEASIRATRDGVVSVWQSLPSEHGFVRLDDGLFRVRLVRDLRLVGSLGLVRVAEVAVAVGVGPVGMLATPSDHDGWTLPLTGRGDEPVRLEAMEAWPSSVLASGAEDAARELVARLLLRLNPRTR